MRTILSFQHRFPKCLVAASASHRATTTTAVGGSFPASSGTRDTATQSSSPQNQRRFYFRTTAVWEEGEAAAAAKTKKPRIDPELKKIAQDFNNRRASYRRQVSLLRKEYAQEVAEQRAADKAEREAQARQATRRRLERQRRKNIQSARNAMLEQEQRQARTREFEAHLEREQVKREARNERYAAARQKVVNELEEEAPLWMTTPEEVEAAFTDEAEQLLWARRGGVLGAPNPTLDAHFWQNETHTWAMTSTYKSQRQILLEEIRELAYEEANVDANFWTPERLEQVEDLELRARLRAEVQRAGRNELLRRQAQMISEHYETGKGEIPKKIPPPNRRFLANHAAMEREGSKIMFTDPTRFFVFDEGTPMDSDGAGDGTQGEASEYRGPTLGAPIDIRKTNSEKYPIPVGRFPIPDTRTEREKKQEEREERMLAAARAAEAEQSSVDLAAEDQDIDDFEPDLDYDNNPWDPDEEEWFRDLREDSPEDEEIRNTPPAYRFKEDDIDWALEKLDEDKTFLEQQFRFEMDSMQQRLRTEIETQSTEEPVSENELQNILLKMSDKELIALSDLDEAYNAAAGDMSAVEFSEFATKIPSLTEEQLRSILDRERE